MERRGESRLRVSKAVKLKVLDRMAGPSLGQPIDAEVVDVSGSGMRLRLRVPVHCGALVEIDDHALLLLGEICRCVQEADGTHTAGLRVFETLMTSDLQESSLPKTTFPARS